MCTKVVFISESNPEVVNEKPYPGLVDFAENYSDRNIVLDLGCGQGRDALFLVELVIE